MCFRGSRYSSTIQKAETPQWGLHTLSPARPFPSVYNDPPLPRSPRSPGGTSGKEPACQCRRRKRRGFDPWVWKIPWRRKWQPPPVLLPGEFHGQRSLWATVRGAAQSGLRLKRLSTHAEGPSCRAASQPSRPTVHARHRASVQTVSITWPALPHSAHSQPLRDGPHILTPRGWSPSATFMLLTTFRVCFRHLWFSHKRECVCLSSAMCLSSLLYFTWGPSLKGVQL